MASIRDVALKAGVGIGTVSRALNGTGYIAEETRRRILAAADELGYRPNELAKNLSRRRSGFVGIVVPDIEHPFFAALLKHVEQSLFQYGYKCMVCDISGKERRELEFLDMLEKSVMDGLIICVDSLAEVDIAGINKPLVCIERKWADNLPLIHSDHTKGGEMAARLFKEAGCRRVVQFMPAVTKADPYLNRHTVFQEVLETSGIEVLRATTLSNRMGYEYDREYVEQFAHLIRQADGVFGSDVVALEALRMARTEGRKVPGELKIVGYDGMPITRMVYPKITAVVQNVPRLARAGVDAIMKRIEGSPVEYNISIDVYLQRGGTI